MRGTPTTYSSRILSSRKHYGLGRALSASSYTQANPYQTNLILDLAPWSVFYPNTDATGTPVTANGASVRSVENRVAAANYLVESAASPTVVDDASGPGGLRYLSCNTKRLTMQNGIMTTASFWFAAVVQIPYSGVANQWLGTVDGADPVTTAGWWMSRGGALETDSFAIAAKTATGANVFGRTGSFTNAQWMIVSGGYSGGTRYYDINRVDQTPYDTFLTYSDTGAHTPSGSGNLYVSTTDAQTNLIQFVQVYDAIPSLADRTAVLNWLSYWSGIA